MRRACTLAVAVAALAVAAPPAMAETKLERWTPRLDVGSAPQQCVTRHAGRRESIWIHKGTWDVTLYAYRRGWAAGPKRKTVRRELPVTGWYRWSTCLDPESLPGQAHPYNTALEMYVELDDGIENHDGEARFLTRSGDSRYLYGTSLKRVR